MRPLTCLTSYCAGAAALALTAAPATGLAADAAALDAGNPNTGDATVDTLVVVANRNPEPLSRIGQSVTVLDTETLRQSQAVALSDILQQTPGVSLVRNGGPGQTTSLGLRGAQAEQTLVLIDGVQLNDPSSPGAGFDFSNLLVGDIARVEILRGSQSTLWGSQAIGGVVNVITTDPAAGLSGDLSAEGGSRSTQYYRGGVGGKLDAFSFRVAGGYYSTAGISAFDSALGGKEPDGFNAGAFSGRARLDVTQDVQLDLRAYYTHAKTAFDGFSTPSFSFGDDSEYGEVTEFVDYTGLNVAAFDGRLKNRLAFEYASTRRRSYDPADAPTPQTFYGDGADTRVEYQGTAQIRPGYVAVFGAQHERTSFYTGSPAFFSGPTAAAFTIDSGYGQVQGEVIKGLTLTGGARYDSHSAYGGHTTGQVAGAWSLNGGTTVLRASWTQGFKTPSLYQLYGDFGNPALRPETSNSADAGVEQRLLGGKLVLSATWFRLSSRNLIDFASCTTPGPFCASRPFGAYFNINRALSQGVELQGSATLADGLTLSANYTHTDATNQLTGKDLARRPRNAANATISYVWPFRLTTAFAIRYASRSFDDVGNIRALHGSTVMDLRAAYPLTDKLEVYGRIENLADEHYETAYQYGSEGRGAFVGVRARF
ncbi:TonB-dependent receptor plug domain-containing protein [Caulobacter sp. KR2-114]|uniref:TonB-dependent receptor plug domain-containing protein n=1 Tax=Caulobacter sp. KR2-114 TaxID=3400912 RepID=UPI003BFAA207